MREDLVVAETLLKRLAEEMDAGRGDEGVADELRDLLEDACRPLSMEEIQKINKYSADLYLDPNAKKPSSY